MFEALKEYSKIIVTGPQRSGTRIVSHIISHDTGHKYIDEKECFNFNKVWKRWMNDKDFVIHAPAMAARCSDFGIDDTLIVFCRRNIDDIIKSQKRINWRCEPEEKYEYKEVFGKDFDKISDKPISEIKYAIWDKIQKKNIKHWLDVDYQSLSKHPLFVDKDRREGFRWDQWKK